MTRHVHTNVGATLKLLGLGLGLGLVIALFIGIVMAFGGPMIGTGVYKSALAGIVTFGFQSGPGAAMSPWIAPIISLCILAPTVVPELPDQLLAALIVPMCAYLTRWLQAWQVAVLSLSVMVATLIRHLRTRVAHISPLWMQQVTYCVSAPRAPILHQ